MDSELNKLHDLSRKFTGNSFMLGIMFHYLEEAFPGIGSNYLLINLHQMCKSKRRLKLRSQIFPRIGPFSTLETMPLFFFPDVSLSLN
jgi:hypothetical protein